ncbi:hypothetical protein CC117_29455 [Parafrankia colletiae]|uniref:Bacterial Ig-like domain-containing protein n=2 Tax=Parafrankia colletiae TaxID=573497 RepID=A0A1S1Q636_9ACTN|nr:Ig-like domain-containing protein [Frankia sp. Cpl3]OHV29057.1 hypothetical protein CC117_29455 [Parafrankia colletiae]
MGMITPVQRREGEPVTVSIALSMVGPSRPTLSGTVDIVVDDSIRHTVTLAPGAGQGTATWTVSLAPGVHRMTAAYSGNEFYQPFGFSGGTTIQNGRLEVTPPERIVAGEPFTVRVKVVPINGATGTPSGTVRLSHGFWPDQATATLDGTGSAIVTLTASFPSGNTPSALVMYVEYLGDGTFLPNTWTAVPAIPYSLPDGSPAGGETPEQAAT